jgi:hypothetical protein
MIAAPVQCDVDGIPKRSHYARLPRITVGTYIEILQRRSQKAPLKGVSQEWRQVEEEVGAIFIAPASRQNLAQISSSLLFPS